LAPDRLIALREQVEAVLAVQEPGPYQLGDRALWLLGGYAGLRLGESLALCWSQVDWVDRRIVTIGRFVPLHDRVAQSIDWLSAGTEEPTQLIFRDPLTGRPLGRGGVLNRLRAACVLAGVPPVASFDSLRQSFALTCAEAGVPLDELARWLGVGLAAVAPYAAGPQAKPAQLLARAFGDLEAVAR